MTRTYRLPQRFYEDHRARDNGETGRIVSETKRHVTVELDAQAYLDLHSDATLYAGYTVADLGPQMFGLIGSAKATLRALESGEPFTAEELAEGKRVWEEQQRALVEENRERRAAYEARERERQAEREAERRAHPRLRARHWPTRNIFSLHDDTDLRVGAVLVTEGLAEYEITELGDEHRGDVPATVRAADGTTATAKIELSVVRR